MTNFGKGWIESEDDNQDYTLTQAVEEIGIIEDAKLRLIYSLLNILKNKESNLIENAEFKEIVPIIVNAIDSEIEREDEQLILKHTLINKLSTAIGETIENTSIFEKKEDTIKEYLIQDLSSRVNLRDIVKIIMRDFTAEAEDKKTIVENTLGNVFNASISELSQHKDTTINEEQSIKLKEILVSFFEKIDSDELISEIAKQLSIEIDSHMSVVKFTLASSQLDACKYSKSPFPEELLITVRNKLFEKTGNQKFQEFNARSKDLVNQLQFIGSSSIGDFRNIIPKQIKKQIEEVEGVIGNLAQMSFNFGTQLWSSLLGLTTQDIDVSQDIKEFINDINLIFYNFEWMLFPIARYATQQHAPLGAIKLERDNELELLIDESLDELFKVNFLELTKKIGQGENWTEENQFSPKEQAAVLALYETIYFGRQVLDDDELQKILHKENRPEPYRLLLLSLVDSYESFINYFNQKLGDPNVNPLLKAISNKSNFLQYIPETNRHTNASNTIFIPMTYASETILKQSGQTGIRLPYCVDLSYWFSPVDDGQGNLNSCTAYAAKAIVEFLHRKAGESEFEASALFLYQATLARKKEDHRDAGTGTSIRDTIRTLVHLGVSPEEHWPYSTEANLANNPPPTCYLAAGRFQINKYFRLDKEREVDPLILLTRMKAILASGLPCIFAIKAISALEQAEKDSEGYIQYLIEEEQDASDLNGEERFQGHALVAVGYDDTVKIASQQGALLVRNTWGSEWGKGGYGWLPYQYVLDKSNRVVDCWALLEWQWIKQGNFGLDPEGWRDNLTAPWRRGQTRS